MKAGDIITLDTKDRVWRQITIQPYHNQRAEILNLSKTTDLMTVRILLPTTFKRNHPSLATEFVYMPKWAAKKTNLMDIE